MEPDPVGLSSCIPALPAFPRGPDLAATRSGRTSQDVKERYLHVRAFPCAVAVGLGNHRTPARSSRRWTRTAWRTPRTAELHRGARGRPGVSCSRRPSRTAAQESAGAWTQSQPWTDIVTTRRRLPRIHSPGRGLDSVSSARTDALRRGPDLFPLFSFEVKNSMSRPVEGPSSSRRSRMGKLGLRPLLPAGGFVTKEEGAKRSKRQSPRGCCPRTWLTLRSLAP